MFFIILLAIVGMVFTERPDAYASVAQPNLTTSPTPPRSPTNTPVPPTTTPEPMPTVIPKSEKGAYIELYIQSLSVEPWTIVQWQDAHGEWHDVEGWQGTLDDSEEKRWWVAPKDFSTGPFRWLVYENAQENLLATSEPFYLPSYADEVIKIEVFLPSESQE